MKGPYRLSGVTRLNRAYIVTHASCEIASCGHLALHLSRWVNAQWVPAHVEHWKVANVVQT